MARVADPRHAVAPEAHGDLAYRPDEGNLLGSADERLVAAAEHQEGAVAAAELQLGKLALVDFLEGALHPDDRARLVPVRDAYRPDPGTPALGADELHLQVERRALARACLKRPAHRL